MGKKLTTEEFIEKSKRIHGNKYDYSLVEYKNNHTKVKIICSEHGIFEQTPKKHFTGQNCPNCSINKKSNSINFIKKSKDIHGDKYNYSLVVYMNAKSKVHIICPIHGVFSQKPNDHLSGFGCKKCGTDKTNKKLLSNKNEFINKSKKIHGDKYDYSLVNYINAKTKVKILCSKHGIFEQTPQIHLRGCGCPICKESKGEKGIRNLLNEKNIKFEYQKKFSECKYVNSLNFDFYLPEYNICIEFDGEQHFKLVERWGGKNGLKKRQIRDSIKNEYCKNNNIRLIRIRYDENTEDVLNISLKF